MGTCVQGHNTWYKNVISLIRRIVNGVNIVIVGHMWLKILECKGLL